MAERPSSKPSSGRSKPSGDAVGQFVIDSEIGKGSFAQVYAGKHMVTGALVAVKSVDLGRLNKKLKENLYGEIKILKTLRHPHIVALHDCVESASHINLIMEYCELGDLSVFIKKRDKLITHPATHEIARKYPNTPNSGLHEVVTRHFLKQLASALEFLREGNFVHRDVKPQNLLLLPSPHFRDGSRTSKHIPAAAQDSPSPAVGLPSLPMLKLADFGFARVLPSTSLAETLCGSPLYMAPEILRYERYNAKADLWSVGTVLYEMVTGKPPFRANNHVELLRKIEGAEDQIKFPRETVISPDMKSLIRALLKRASVERLSFDAFFSHPVVTGPIPGLVEDDMPKEERRMSRDYAMQPDEPDELVSLSRRHSLRRHVTEETGHSKPPNSPRPLRSSPLATPVHTRADAVDEAVGDAVDDTPHSPRPDQSRPIRRPGVQPSTSAPSGPALLGRRGRVASNASANIPEQISPSYPDERIKPRPTIRSTKAVADDQERAHQDMAFEREYVLVDKKHLEVNALADQISMQQRRGQGGQMVRRATQQGVPTSTTGAVPSLPSRTLQMAQGRNDVRPAHERGIPNKPGSVITKAIQDASVRLFGIKIAHPFLGKGQSPPQGYNPFPNYPTSVTPLGLIGDGKGTPVDEDSRVAQLIEDLATQSDVVFGFAEVKYKQLVPLAPSTDHGLGRLPAEQVAAEDENGLTVEAVVSLSEEALVLYVKALSMLAKSMDMAGLWWARKQRTEGHAGARDGSISQQLSGRINSAVQWIRNRFNEVLEKAEIVRLRLMNAQKDLPDDHASHPGRQTNVVATSGCSTGCGTDGVFLTPGISAEKLVYERAIEMSRTAAINEVANEDLRGCELSYITAIRMLEAVLASDDDMPPRLVSGSFKREKTAVGEDMSSEMNAEDQVNVAKMIKMISGRLTLVRRKLTVIETASRAQQQQELVRRRSGEMKARSVPSA